MHMEMENVTNENVTKGNRIWENIQEQKNKYTKGLTHYDNASTQKDMAAVH